jgi:NAD(P)H dehydrogenase (quinone)
MSHQNPILVTGAAGKVGAVGRTIVELLRQHNLPVRALVRRHDERAEALGATGAEVVVGDLTRAVDVAHALEGCRRMYFGMSVSPLYLEATVICIGLDMIGQSSDLGVRLRASDRSAQQATATGWLC